MRRLVALAAAALLAAVAGAPPAAGAVAPTTQKTVFGSSVLGRPLVVVHRTYPGLSTKRVLVLGQTHGDEEDGKRVAAALVSASSFPTSLDLWVVVTVNPDGDVANRRTNAHGVDVNRNFPYAWAPGPRGSTWPGPSAGSEPETKAVARLVARIAPRWVVSFHTPLYGVDTDQTKGLALARELSRRSGYPLKDFSCSGGCHGTMTQWVNARTAGAQVVFELGRTATTTQLARVVSATEQALVAAR